MKTYDVGHKEFYNMVDTIINLPYVNVYYHENIIDVFEDNVLTHSIVEYGIGGVYIILYNNNDKVMAFNNVDS